jgi:hypothetical protein
LFNGIRNTFHQGIAYQLTDAGIKYVHIHAVQAGTMLMRKNNIAIFFDAILYSCAVLQSGR